MKAIKKALCSVAMLTASLAVLGLFTPSAHAACGVFAGVGTTTWCGNIASLVQTSSPQNEWVWVGTNNCQNNASLLGYATVRFSAGGSATTPYFTAAGWNGWTWGSNISQHAPFATCFS